MQRNWTEDRNGLPRTSWQEGPFEVVIQCKIDSHLAGIRARLRAMELTTTGGSSVQDTE